MIRPLHVVGRQRHRRDEALRDVIRRAPLDGGGEDRAGAAVRVLFDLRLDLAGAAVRGIAHFLLDGGEEDRARLVPRQVGDALEFGNLACAQGLRLGADRLDIVLARVEVLIALLELGGFAVERLFLLLNAALLPRDIAPLLLQFALDLLAEAERVIFGGEREFPLLRPC